MLDGKIFPTRCDCTNLQKLYEDCLKGIVIKDDRQVIVVTSYKCYGEEEGVDITVQDLFEYFKEHEQGIEDAVKERQEQESDFRKHPHRNSRGKASTPGGSNCPK